MCSRSSLLASRSDLPLHDGGVVATERQQIGVPRVETYFSDVTAVTDQRLEARALLHGRVAVELDLTIIICRGDDFLTAG